MGHGDHAFRSTGRLKIEPCGDSLNNRSDGFAPVHHRIRVREPGRQALGLCDGELDKPETCPAAEVTVAEFIIDLCREAKDVGGLPCAQRWAGENAIRPTQPAAKCSGAADRAIFQWLVTRESGETGCDRRTAADKGETQCHGRDAIDSRNGPSIT